MKITRAQLEAAAHLYWSNVFMLPKHLQEACPAFKEFLAPDTYPYLGQADYVTLSPLGVQRYKMLHSPHVLTLLTLYVLQQLEASEEAR